MNIKTSPTTFIATLLVVFVAGWVDILPNPIDSLVLVILPPVIVITLIVTAGGLCAKKKGILRAFSTFTAIICLALSVYFVMFGGEQGAIGAFFAWFFGGVACAVVYLILVTINFSQKHWGESASNN